MSAAAHCRDEHAAIDALLAVIEGAIEDTDRALRARDSTSVAHAADRQRRHLDQLQRVLEAEAADDGAPAAINRAHNARLRQCKIRLDAQRQVLTALTAINTELLRCLCGTSDCGYTDRGEIDQGLGLSLGAA